MNEYNEKDTELTESSVTLTEQAADDAAERTDNTAAEAGEADEISENVHDNSDGSEDAPVSKPFSEAYDWASSLVYAVLAMLVLNLFVFRSITVDGTSMNNTLEHQDRIIATNLFYTPEFGDIVVVQADMLYNEAAQKWGEPIIKRVIGVAGDTLRFDFDKGEVYRNGVLLQEDYIAEPTHLRLPGWVESGVDYTVPENTVFVMGDNRNRSHDSRDLVKVGYVDTNLIMGKALIRVYPFSSFEIL